MYEQMKKNFYEYLGEELCHILKGYKAIVAGGAITSIFSQREINDIDIYFRHPQLTEEFVKEIYNFSHMFFYSEKAFSFKYKEKTLQAIFFNYFENCQDIFKSFDFTCCMGAFDFETEEFILHEDFLTHNSQRKLIFNEGSGFPVTSLIRSEKYKQKGYSLPFSQFMKICLSITKIDSDEDFIKNIAGMYGLEINNDEQDLDHPNLFKENNYLLSGVQKEKHLYLPKCIKKMRESRQ